MSVDFVLAFYLPQDIVVDVSTAICSIPAKGYEDWLTPTEMDDLNLLFQKRHLLAHTEGIVDEKYIRKTGDNTYKVDQRIVVRDSEVRRLVELINKIADEIRAVAGSP